MAKIRTVLADPNLRGGSVGSRADAASMGSASASRMGDLAQGLDAAASGASAYAQTVQRIDNHLKDVNDTIAFNQAKVAIQKASTDFLNDPEAQKKDTFHKDYETFMKTQLETARAGASKEAGINIQNVWGSVMSSGYANASQAVVSRQLEQAGVAISDGLNADLTSIMGTGGDLKAAASSVIQQSFEQSDKVFGTLMPKRNQAFKEQVVQGAVLRVVEKDPATARALLAEHAKNLDPRSFHDLTRVIDRAEDNRRSEGVAAFTDLAEQTVYSAYTGKGPDPKFVDSALNKARFTEVYGASGELRYNAFRAEYDAVTEARSTFNDIKGLNPAAQMERFGKYLEKHGGDRHKAKAVNMLESMVRENQQMLAKDAPQWLTTNNEAVASAFLEYENVRKTGSPEQRIAATQTYLDRLIKYQGVAPEGASPDEARMYLNRSRPSLLTKAQANEWATQLSNASTDQFLQMTAQVEQLYPTTEKLNYFLSDLMNVKEGNGVDLRFQVYLQNRSNPNLAAIIESNRDSESLKKLDTNVAKDLADAMAGSVDPLLNTAWQGLGQSRADSVAAMRDVIYNYARTLAMPGKMSVSKAVTTAFDQVFRHTLFLGNVKGNPTVLPKEVDGLRYDDQNMGDIQLSLERAIDLFDASDVDLSSFPLVSSFLPDNQYKKEEVERILRDKARVSVSADGKHMQLLVEDDLGKPFLLRDKYGNPYQVDINTDLSEFAKDTVETVVTPPSPDTVNLDGVEDLSGLGSITPYMPESRVVRRRVRSTQWKSSTIPSLSQTYWPLRKE